jgi:glycosyltransferase involved in cell wall biosynthesis
MLLTVVVCTWNRAVLLERTLEQMTLLETAPGLDWELLVVNNNCTDDTDAVLARFNGRLPLRRLFEPQAGQTFARNRAIGEARGEYIVWTDDDVLVDPGWLAAYGRAFERWPEAGVFGGPVEPWFEGEPPGWLRSIFHDVDYAYAAVDYGGADCALQLPKQLPVGANMAFHAEDQRRYLYDTTLGLRESGGSRGDESEAILRMLAGGREGRWVADARVRHYIPQARQSLDYLRSFFMSQGRYEALQDRTPARRVLFGRPLWAWRQALTYEVAFRAGRLANREPRLWLDSFREASITWGYISGYVARRSRGVVP